MSPRLDYQQQAPQLFHKLVELGSQVRKSSLPPSMIDLINLRASQLNGCAFCVDMHVKEATIRGERPLRLHHVAIWRESELFSPRERAALAWTETLTQIPRDGVPDEIYDSVRVELSEKEISDLTFAIMAINAWNRVNIAFRIEPGSRDTEYGLTRAALA